MIPAWVNNLFRQKICPSRAAKRRLQLSPLEDRLTPANIINVQSGGSLFIPAGATTFADNGIYTIDPSALSSSVTPITLQANTVIHFLDSVDVQTPGVTLTAQAKVVINVEGGTNINTGNNDL